MNRSTFAEIGGERDGGVPSVRPVDQQRLADQQVALDIVMVDPKPAVGALRAIVTHRQELILFQLEIDPAAILRLEKLRGFPKRRIGENPLDQLRVRAGLAGKTRRPDVIVVFAAAIDRYVVFVTIDPQTRYF